MVGGRPPDETTPALPVVPIRLRSASPASGALRDPQARASPLARRRRFAQGPVRIPLAADRSRRRRTTPDPILRRRAEPSGRTGASGTTGAGESGSPHAAGLDRQALRLRSQCGETTGASPRSGELDRTGARFESRTRTAPTAGSAGWRASGKRPRAEPLRGLDSRPRPLARNGVAALGGDSPSEGRGGARRPAADRLDRDRALVLGPQRRRGFSLSRLAAHVAQQRPFADLRPRGGDRGRGSVDRRNVVIDAFPPGRSETPTVHNPSPRDYTPGR